MRKFVCVISIWIWAGLSLGCNIRNFMFWTQFSFLFHHSGLIFLTIVMVKWILTIQFVCSASHRQSLQSPSHFYTHTQPNMHRTRYLARRWNLETCQAVQEKCLLRTSMKRIAKKEKQNRNGKVICKQCMIYKQYSPNVVTLKKKEETFIKASAHFHH